MSNPWTGAELVRGIEAAARHYEDTLAAERAQIRDLEAKVERLRAGVRLLEDDHITPWGRRILNQILDADAGPPPEPDDYTGHPWELEASTLRIPDGVKGIDGTWQIPPPCEQGPP